MNNILIKYYILNNVKMKKVYEFMCINAEHVIKYILKQ